MHPDPIIYFAGPSQHSLCSWMAGHHVLESYANLIDGEKDRVTGHWVAADGNLSRYRLTFASMALDPGAYSNLTAAKGDKGPVVTIDGYIEHAKAHGRFYDWCASFDDITGGAEGNVRNWERCRAAGIHNLMPVFHQGEPWELLEEYCRGPFVGLGLQRPIQAEVAWLDSCFSRIPSSVWVHGFAMTSYLRWPFRSVDSKTWMHELLDLMKTSGQGRSALRFLSQPEMLQIVLKKYQREWREDLWRGTFGVAAGRGEQVDLEELLREMSP
jgi:hypothetical protein